MHTVFGERDTDSIADAIRQVRANSNRALIPRVFAFAVFGHAEVDRVVPILSLLREPRDEGERKSSGGILIPATAQVAKRLIWAEVLAVGNHVRAVELGDRVLFSPDDRHEVEIAGDNYLLLRERDIHAVAADRIQENTGLYL